MERITISTPDAASIRAASAFVELLSTTACLSRKHQRSLAGGADRSRSPSAVAESRNSDVRRGGCSHWSGPCVSRRADPRAQLGAISRRPLQMAGSSRLCCLSCNDCIAPEAKNLLFIHHNVNNGGQVSLEGSPHCFAYLVGPLNA